MANSRSRFSQVAAERISQTYIFFLSGNAKNSKSHLRTCRVSRKDARTVLIRPWKRGKREREKSLAVVAGLWNMQEWECAATCNSDEQQRVSRVQMPRNFVHPWVICGAMPNAGARRAFQYAYTRGVQLHSRACTCIRIPKTQTADKPATSPPAIVACIRMTITELPWLKERSRNAQFISVKDLSLLQHPPKRSIFLKTRMRQKYSIFF